MSSLYYDNGYLSSIHVWLLDGDVVLLLNSAVYIQNFHHDAASSRRFMTK
jgi:sulfur transfer complex TusBCD TusB component (DsrH family)